MNLTVTPYNFNQKSMPQSKVSFGEKSGKGPLYERLEKWHLPKNVIFRIVVQDEYNHTKLNKAELAKAIAESEFKKGFALAYVNLNKISNGKLINALRRFVGC